MTFQRNDVGYHELCTIPGMFIGFVITVGVHHVTDTLVCVSYYYMNPTGDMIV